MKIRRRKRQFRRKLFRLNLRKIDGKELKDNEKENPGSEGTR